MTNAILTNMRDVAGILPHITVTMEVAMTFCPHRFKNRVCVRCGITWEKANEAACAAFRGLPRENAVTWITPQQTRK